MNTQINHMAQRQIDKIAVKCAEIKPLVAINCITYNHEKYLRDALDGFVMQQTDFPFVAIVHDDASTDGTAAIMREYAENYRDIILPIYESENQYSKGNGSVRKIMNKACNATGAKYVAMCEGDDYWTDPLKLQKQVDALEAHPECSISLNRVQTIDRNRNKQSWTIPPIRIFSDGIVCLDDLVRSEFRDGDWTFHTSSFFYRAELGDTYVELKDTLFKKFPYGDMPLLLTCLLNGKGYFYSDIMGNYRLMSGGYTSNMNANPDLAAEEIRLVAEALEDFDRYTGGRYHKALKMKANRNMYRAICNEYGFSYKLFRPCFAPLYKSTLLRFAKYKIPWLYSAYQWLKREVKG